MLIKYPRRFHHSGYCYKQRNETGLLPTTTMPYPILPTTRLGLSECLYTLMPQTFTVRVVFRYYKVDKLEASLNGPDCGSFLPDYGIIYLKLVTNRIN